jgi:hypothetical protein
MQSLLQSSREKAIIQSLVRIEGDPQILVGMQFRFRIPDQLEYEKVEVLEVGDSSEELTVKRVSGEEIYEGVRIGQLSIGRERTSGEPLLELMAKHGFDPGPILRQMSSGLRRGGAKVLQAHRGEMERTGRMRAASGRSGEQRRILGRLVEELQPFWVR